MACGCKVCHLITNSFALEWHRCEMKMVHSSICELWLCPMGMVKTASTRLNSMHENQFTEKPIAMEKKQHENQTHCGQNLAEWTRFISKACHVVEFAALNYVFWATFIFFFANRERKKNTHKRQTGIEPREK